MTAEAKDKIRVAILGGGIAALTTAFELTEQDPEKTTYEVTLYTLGWRLGGKASVGRDMTNGGRAVEHGLHIWAGYYDNSFDIVRAEVDMEANRAANSSTSRSNMSTAKTRLAKHALC